MDFIYSIKAPFVIRCLFVSLCFFTNHEAALPFICKSGDCFVACPFAVLRASAHPRNDRREALLTMMRERVPRFAYHPHVPRQIKGGVDEGHPCIPLPSREREFWLAITDALFAMNELRIPRKEKEYE